MLTHMCNILFLTVLFTGKVHITFMTVLSVLLNRGAMNSKLEGVITPSVYYWGKYILLLG